MKKKTVAIIFIVVALLSSITGVVLFLQTGKAKEENPVEVIEQVIETTEEPTEALEEVITEPTEEPTETTVEAEPETKVTEEPIVTEAPTEVTPETTTAKVVEVKPEQTTASTPKPEPTPEPTEAPTPEPTEAPTPEPTEAPTPTPEVIVEATEEEMITGKFNKFNSVVANNDWTADYTDEDWHFVSNESEVFTVTKYGLESSGSFNSVIAEANWTNSANFTSTFQYGDNIWKHVYSDGDVDENRYSTLTKEITNFGFNKDRFKVTKSEFNENTMTISGTYNVSTNADTLYDMVAMEVFNIQEVVGDINNVTANVTITINSTTKSMEKVVMNYNLNGEIFGTLNPNTGDLDVSITSYTSTVAFK